MTRDPFLRLALIALCSAYALGIAAVAAWLGDRTAIGVLLFGSTFALVLSFEAKLPKPPARVGPDPRRFKTPGRVDT